MKNNKYEVDVIVEISKNSNVKYEYDEEEKILVCNRVLHTPFTYIFNYGYIPHTLSPDGDPLDAVILMDDELIPNCKIRCRILGCLETSDDKGFDPKLILCPSMSVDPSYARLNNITDVTDHTLEKIRYFFAHYKDLENKNVHIGNLLDRDSALQIFESSVVV